MAACDQSPSEPPVANDAELAFQRAEESALGQARMFRHGPPGTRLVGPLFFPNEDGSQPACREVDGQTRCPPAPPEGVEASHQVTFYDADGNVQEAFVEGSTASVSFVIDVNGTRSRGPGSGAVERHHELTVTGLVNDPSSGLWNGTATSSSNMTRTPPMGDGQSFTHVVVSETTVQNVMVPRPRSPDGWPLSGTITQQISITGDGPRGAIDQDVTAVVTFNGTRYATLTVNGESRQLDLTRKPGRRGGPGGG